MGESEACVGCSGVGARAGGGGAAVAHPGAAGARLGAAHGAGALLPAAAPRPARTHARAVRGLAAAGALRAELREHPRRVPRRRSVALTFELLQSNS